MTQNCDYEYTKINSRLEQAGRSQYRMNLEALCKQTEKSLVFHICHKAIKIYEGRKNKTLSERLSKPVCGKRFKQESSWDEKSKCSNSLGSGSENIIFLVPQFFSGLTPYNEPILPILSYFQNVYSLRLETLMQLFSVRKAKDMGTQLTNLLYIEFLLYLLRYFLKITF